MNYIPLEAAMVKNYVNGGAPYGGSISGASIEAVGAVINAHGHGAGSFSATQLSRTISPDDLHR